MIVDMPREAKVGGGVWHEYILLMGKRALVVVMVMSVRAYW